MSKSHSIASNRIVEVRTDAAPAPVGPYSQAVVHGGLVYASGQIPLVPETGKIVEGDVEVQTRQVLDNLRAVLRAAGSGFEHALKVTIFLADIADFPRVNALYAKAFTGDPAPARATVQVAALPLAALVEMDAVARIPGDG
jgi:2-iminobutanoate/2-iminopropanoate deaminase